MRRCLVFLADCAHGVLTVLLLNQHHSSFCSIAWMFFFGVQIWFTTDNGPEMNCPPEGICQGHPHRPQEGPGSAGPLRGRKRDIFEGGHRVPGIVSYPPELATTTDATTRNLVSWETVTTMDFLPTVMEVLGVDRPAEQASWAMDGRSILPLLQNPTGFRWSDTPEGVRSIGLGYFNPKLNIDNGYGYRYGRWKYVEGSTSCHNADCNRPLLFDLETDLGERHDLSQEHPELLQDLQAKFLDWHSSVVNSRKHESKCQHTPQELALPESLSPATQAQ